MCMSESRVRVSLTEGIFEFEGSEAFVAAHVDKFARMIHAAVAVQWPGSIDTVAQAPGAVSPDAPTVAVDAPAPPVAPQQPAPAPPPSPDVEFADMFAMTPGGVQILKRVPGASCAQRTVNGASLYLYGIRLLKK